MALNLHFWEGMNTGRRLSPIFSASVYLLQVCRGPGQSPPPIGWKWPGEGEGSSPLQIPVDRGRGVEGKHQADPSAAVANLVGGPVI